MSYQSKTPKKMSNHTINNTRDEHGYTDIVNEGYQNTSSHIPWFKTILPVGFYNPQSNMAHVNCCCTKPSHTLDIKNQKDRGSKVADLQHIKSIFYHRFDSYEKLKHYTVNSLIARERNTDRREFFTRLMSVNSLNSSILVAHASSCSYPKPVTKRDCST